jgi:hypothetical protein
MIHTTNDVMRSLLLQASLLAHYWAESLYAATYLLNLLPTKAISIPTPYFALFGTTPSYAHLQVFMCACYPNTFATAPHKLGSHFCWCAFLGYSSDHKGYQCLDLTMNHLLISRPVVLNESSFPFASFGPPPNDLDSLFSSSPMVHAIAPPYPSSVVGTSEIVTMPRVAPVPQPTPHAVPMPTPHVAPTSPSASSSVPRTALASRFTQPPPPTLVYLR